MKQAKQEIIQVQCKGSLYYVSIVEKQNDSGIMFNDRIFFLLPRKHIGYISEVKIDDPPSKIDFEKAKIIIPIPQIKTVVQLDRELHIKLVQTEATKKIQKDWVLRMSTIQLTKMWYDRLHHEKIIDIQKKTTPKNDRNPIPEQFKSKKSESKVSPSKKVLQITRSQSLTFNLKPQGERVETGVGVTPDNSELSINRNIIEKKEVGTITSVKDAPIAQKKQPLREERPQSITNKQASVVRQEQKVQASPQKSTVINKASREPQNEGKTERSFAEQEKYKSVRSEPINRNSEPLKFSRKEYQIQHKPKDNEYKQEKVASNPPPLPEDKSSTSMIRLQKQLASKDNSQQAASIRLSNKRESPKSQVSSLLQKQQEKKMSGSGIKSIKSLKRQEVGQKLIPQQQKNGNLGLSNKKYITQQQFQKLNTSTPISYIQRTSKLIKSSTKRLQLPQSPKSHQILSNSNHVGNEAINYNSNKSVPDNTSKSVPSPKQPKTTEAKPSMSASNIKFSIPELKEEDDEQNQSLELHRIIKDQFSSIQKETSVLNEEAYINEEPLQNQQALPWTFKYIQFGDQIFEQFKQYCKDLLQVLIQDMRLPPHKQTFKQKLLRNNIYYFEVDDVEVKIATIQIQEAQSELQRSHKDRVCNKNSLKMLQNQYNNFHLLYQHLGESSKVKVPLVCLCEVNGFMGLFKILSVSLDKQIRMRQLEDDIAELRLKTKISNNFYHNHNKNIIQLDQQYYKNINKSSNKEDTSNFNCYFIQQVQEYLLSDYVTNRTNGQKVTLLRKELIEKYAEITQDNTNKNKSIQKLYERPSKDYQKVSKNILKVISQIIIQIDSLSVYFLNSRELSDYFHQKGINLRYLGHVYQHLGTSFQKRVLMSEIAARSCKALFRKTIQDITLEDQVTSPQAINIKICDFLNCVTSNSIQTATIWKVLSSHAVKYFGVELNFQQIDKGYFLVSLIQNCRLRVAWDKTHPMEVFKESMLFTEKNIFGVESIIKIYEPYHNPLYLRCLQILNEPHSQKGMSELLQCLQLRDTPPPFLHSLYSKIRTYLSLFISPTRAKQEMGKVSLYSDSQKEEPSRVYFDLLLMQIKWHLKYKDRQNYIKKCDQFIRYASKFFGQFHPIFSQLYDMFSSYHQSCLQFEDSITFAKSSLVNILKVCGTAHEKTSECYYNLALCYIKSNKKEEAFAHIKKAKSIFQSNGRSNSIPYAVISLKLALIHLNQDQTEQCLKAALASLQIFEKQQLSTYQEEVVDCYEMITRCYEVLQEKGKIQEVAQRCEGQLREISAAHNLQRLLKIIAYPFLSQLPPENASLYIDIITQLPNPSQDTLYSIAFENIRVRIAEDTLMKDLTDYTDNLQQIERYLRESNLLQQWQSFKQAYPRETINDFVALTEELIAFLGEGFVSGSLREAL